MWPCIVLFGMVQSTVYYMVWYSVIRYIIKYCTIITESYRMVWYIMVCHGMILYCVLWYGMVLCDKVLYCTIITESYRMG